MNDTRQQLQVRLRTAETSLDVSIAARDALPYGSPERGEWDGIVYACMSEARHARSDLDRLDQAASCERAAHIRAELIVDSARHCESALARADAEHGRHDFNQEAFWRERAAFWSAQAFRQVAA